MNREPVFVIFNTNTYGLPNIREGLPEDVGEGKVRIELEPHGAEPFHGMPLRYEQPRSDGGKGLEVVPINTIYSFTQEAVTDTAGAVEYWVCTMIVSAAEPVLPSMN